MQPSKQDSMKWKREHKSLFLMCAQNQQCIKYVDWQNCTKSRCNDDDWLIQPSSSPSWHTHLAPGGASPPQPTDRDCRQSFGVLYAEASAELHSNSSPHSYKMRTINCFTVFCATVITFSIHFYPPPPKSDNNYDLRKNRPHDRTLVTKTTLTECDYIMRMIFKDVY